jgi:hypothetical protein
MFQFAALGRFDFDARLLSVQSINDAKHEGGEDSEPDAAKQERGGRAASDNETSNRDLVWRDSRFAKERDYRSLDWRVDVSGKIQCALLRGIQNNALSETTLLCPRRRKTEWPHMPAHADDVIVNF